ncbi:MAG: hypothetical protein ACI31M_04800 [Bacilli bacterium]
MKLGNKNGIIVKRNSLKDMKGNIKFQIQTVMKKKVGKYSIRQISIILFLVLMTILVIKNIFYLFDPERNVPDYSIVYRAEDGDLMVTTKDGKETTKLASNTLSVVRYSNSTDRYILYTKEDNLYLFDKNKGDKTKRIVGNITNIFGFSNNDKYLYYINKDKELYTYKGKEIKIDEDVDYIYGVSNKYITYQKAEEIYYAKLNGKDKEKITSKATNVMINDDGEKIFYINEDTDLYFYEIGAKRPEKIDNNVIKVLDVSDDFKNIIYAKEDDDIYISIKGKTKKLVSEASALYYFDAQTRELVYACDDKVYYQKEDKDSIEVTDNENISSAYLYKNELYYTIYEDGEYSLLYSKLGSKNASKPKEVLDNVDDKIITGYKKGLIVLSERNGTIATLNIVKGGKVKEINEDVLVSSIIYGHNKKSLYFIGDYENKDSEGNLMKSTGGKAKKILDGVYNFNYIKDKLIYVQVNYSSNDGRTDLRVIYKDKVKNIADDIKEMYNVPVIIK